MNENLIWRYHWYRQSELEGGLLLGRLIGKVEDPQLVHELTRHAAEEVEHSRLWDEVIQELHFPHVRIHRSYQSLFLNHGPAPATLLEVLCFTQIFERRVHLRFSAEIKHPETPEPARRAYQRMLDDEAGHLSWVAYWLRQQEGANDLLRHYQRLDHLVLQDIQPYENDLKTFPGLGKLCVASPQQLHPHELQSR